MDNQNFYEKLLELLDEIEESGEEVVNKVPFYDDDPIDSFFKDSADKPMMVSKISNEIDEYKQEKFGPSDINSTEIKFWNDC